MRKENDIAASSVSSGRCLRAYLLGLCLLSGTLMAQVHSLQKNNFEYDLKAVERTRLFRNRLLATDCNVSNCWNCKNGNPNLCSTCSVNYLISADNTLCSETAIGIARAGDYRSSNRGNFVWWSSKIFWWILKVLNTLAKVLILIFRSVPGFLVDRLDASLNYLNNLPGNPLFYPIITLEPYFRGSIFVANIPSNPSESYANDSQCVPRVNFKYAGRQCNLLYNYGAKLVTLCFYLLLGSVVSLVCLVLFKKHSKTPLTVRALSLVILVNDYFGVRYFGSLMEAVSAELIGDSIHNIFKEPNTGPMYLGFAISIVILLFYIVYAVGLGIYLYHVRKYGLTKWVKDMSYNEVPHHARVNSEAHSLVDQAEKQSEHQLMESRVSTLHPFVAWFFELHLETFNRTKHTSIYVFTPLILFVRMAAIQLVLSASSEVPILQNSLVLVLEVIALVVIIVGRTKDTTLENIHDILLQVGYTGYVLMRTLLTLEIDYGGTIWKGGHFLTVLILFCIIGLTIAFCVYLMVRRFIEFLKNCRGKGNKVAIAPAPKAGKETNKMEVTSHPGQSNGVAGQIPQEQAVQGDNMNSKTAQKNKQTILHGQTPPQPTPGQPTSQPSIPVKSQSPLDSNKYTAGDSEPPAPRPYRK